MAHILLVTDDPALCALHLRVFADMDHLCDVAADGNAGLTRLSEKRYDLVVAHEDVRPGDGLAWLRSVREEQGPDIPLLLEGGPGLAVEALGAGVCEVLGLPPDADRLRRAVDRALQRSDPLLGPGESRQARIASLRSEIAERAHAARIQTAEALLEQMTERGLSVVAERGRRLASYGAILAARLGLSQADTEDIQIGAMLHDVGLLVQAGPPVPPGAPLTAEAWRQRQRHPTDGAELLRSIPALAGAAPLVENHHERHDGLGYPARRAGEDIPMAARVFAVAEAFDAMLRGRAAVPGMGLEEALEAVEAGADEQFDPQVTAVLASALAEMMRAHRGIDRAG